MSDVVQCPGCAARNGERCSIDCTCGACEVEPPEADGEDFRGGERRAYEQDQQAHMQETLK